MVIAITGFVFVMLVIMALIVPIYLAQAHFVTTMKSLSKSVHMLAKRAMNTAIKMYTSKILLRYHVHWTTLEKVTAYVMALVLFNVHHHSSVMIVLSKIVKTIALSMDGAQLNIRSADACVNPVIMVKSVIRKYVSTIVLIQMVFAIQLLASACAT